MLRVHYCIFDVMPQVVLSCSRCSSHTVSVCMAENHAGPPITITCQYYMINQQLNLKIAERLFVVLCSILNKN